MSGGPTVGCTGDTFGVAAPVAWLSALLPLVEVIPQSYVPDLSFRLRSPRAQWHTSTTSAQHLVDVAPPPDLARLCRAHHRMADIVEMRRGVFTRTRIAAPHVATVQADAQVSPMLFAELHAVLTHADVAVRRRWIGRGVDSGLRELWTSGCRGTLAAGLTGTGTRSTEQSHAPLSRDCTSQSG